MKIPAPTIPPITIMVASNKPICRSSWTGATLCDGVASVGSDVIIFAGMCECNTRAVRGQSFDRITLRKSLHAAIDRAHPPTPRRAREFRPQSSRSRARRDRAAQCRVAQHSRRHCLAWLLLPAPTLRADIESADKLRPLAAAPDHRARDIAEFVGCSDADASPVTDALPSVHARIVRLPRSTLQSAVAKYLPAEVILDPRQPAIARLTRYPPRTVRHRECKPHVRRGPTAHARPWSVRSA